MNYLFDSIKLLPFEMRDPKTRKTVFREAGKTYTKFQSDLTDRPGAIARLMEMAFNAGKAQASEVSSTTTGTAPVADKMYDINIPSLSREVFDDFRRYLVGLRSDGVLPRLEDYALVLERGSGVKGRKGRDRWLEYGQKSDRSRSTKAIGPLMKLGLFEKTFFELSDGEEAEGVVITEWGIELLLTGATAKADDRKVGGSSTYSTYLALMEHQPLPRAEGMISVWDLDSFVAGFILDHRVNGVGRPERLEGGACVEDIAYCLQALEYPSAPEPIKIWRLYRQNLETKAHMFGRLVSDLLDEGILLAEAEGQLLMSEWGYELVRTGSTIVPDGRIAGKSSTYRDYAKILSRHVR